MVSQSISITPCPPLSGWRYAITGAQSWSKLARRCCRSGEADVQDEVTEPDIHDAAACQVHNPGQQDDDKDDQNKQCKEQDDSGDGVPGYRPVSSHV
jgi:hypothetical protein